MFGLPLIDILVILLYFIIVIIIGFWSSRRIKNQQDYFLAGRKFGKVVQTFAAFGQATSVETAVGVTTTTYTNGAGGIWSTLLMLFATPFYWMISPWFRRLRLLTMGDFFIERYGSRNLAGIYAIVGSLYMLVTISMGLTAMTKTIVAITPKSIEQLSPKELAQYNAAIELENYQQRDYLSLSLQEQERLSELQFMNPRKIFPSISENALTWAVCFIVIIYTVAGGLEAAFLTDLLQGFFIIVLSFIMLPFAWAKINTLYGGSNVMDALTTIHIQLPESLFDLFGSPSTIDFTWYYIAAAAVMSTLNTVVQPNVLTATGSAKDEYTARVGYTTGNFMKRFCTVLWGIFGLAAIVLYRDTVHNPDLVWGYATRDLLGSYQIGLVGLMIACLMAALMSTADCLMITASSLLTHNIYHPLFPNRSERHYIRIGRIGGTLVVLGGGLLAFQFDSIFQIMKFTWEFNIVVAAGFWLGIKWRRSNRKAAWASVVTTLILFPGLSIVSPMLFPSMRTNSYLLKMTDPKPLERVFVAHEADVIERQREMAEWDKLSLQGKAEGARPAVRALGGKFVKTDKLPKRSIFWTQGIKIDEQGKIYGDGMVSLELAAVELLGFDLAKNSYALNETIRILIRTITPFLILIITAFLTGSDDKAMLDRFFGKMRTPVHRDPKRDAEEMALTTVHPNRFNHNKLFPNSNWEFDKWDKLDFWGFSISVLVLFAIITMLKILVSLGG